ncbi:hypothetical protein [Prauserella flavalba]|uniref:hypothetical protein n=1 Tax=Prauserella flavalba TaxID=1477506 RepID=UPI0036EBDF16
MATWSLTTKHTQQRGDADTTADAWDAAYRAAAEHVRARVLGPISLEVDGDHASVHPAESGDLHTDVANTLDGIESSRLAALAAHRDAQ